MNKINENYLLLYNNNHNDLDVYNKALGGCAAKSVAL